ncbi:2-oxo acid dehydrogenase subunit E2 [Chamaesiphon polymorphus]|uniref:Dihydrolipoamide acyltransferase n=1 Tax=Chamaesiphon polymorphus CCALA 037 TaxID=2107692 RepID=A0A2T1GE28_9CYAN|nr:2-oxo acid dehydrogenase subunit E2 [Chamaesiphon polymorphus]PSB55724.1 dihydrolipoamide acyltransferase [Chamaesiphon polymorphus CCALA 037]
MEPVDLIGSFETRNFPSFRNPTIDTLNWGRHRHHIPILVEIDVTAARAAIHALKVKMGKGISFTGWIVKCLAQAVSEHKYVHALRNGKRQLVIFDDVDVSIVIERAVAGEKLPMPYIIRKANEKTLARIHAEIRTAQTSPVEVETVQLGSTQTAWLTQIFMLLPQFVRDLLFWQPLFRDPFRIKRMMGTVSVTAVGMFGGGGMSWGIPIGIHPLLIAVGGIAKRPGVIDNRMEIREYVGMTVMFDHDVTDGAPVARFMKRLQELMTSGYGLETAPMGDIHDPIDPQIEA